MPNKAKQPSVLAAVFGVITHILGVSMGEIPTSLEISNLFPTEQFPKAS